MKPDMDSPCCQHRCRQEPGNSVQATDNGNWKHAYQAYGRRRTQDQSEGSEGKLASCIAAEAAICPSC